MKMKHYTNFFRRTLTFSMILVALLAFNDMSYAQVKTQIVAHRGYWNTEGSYENTISSLENAHKAGLYGSEFDINMTSDGVLVVCHGPAVGNIQDVQKASFSEVMHVKLANGEGVPTLEEYLKAGKKGFKVKGADGSAKNVKLQLVAEVKAAAPQVEEEVIIKLAALVKKLKLQEQISVISFSYNACVLAAKHMPGVLVQYLMGDKTPEELKEAGINGLDYHYSLMLLNSDYIERAHKLGMTVNVWTVNDRAQMDAFVKLGVDYITTDYPELAKEVIEENNKAQFGAKQLRLR